MKEEDPQTPKSVASPRTKFLSSEHIGCPEYHGECTYQPVENKKSTHGLEQLWLKRFPMFSSVRIVHMQATT